MVAWMPWWATVDDQRLKTCGVDSYDSSAPVVLERSADHRTPTKRALLMAAIEPCTIAVDRTAAFTGATGGTSDAACRRADVSLLRMQAGCKRPFRHSSP